MRKKFSLSATPCPRRRAPWQAWLLALLLPLALLRPLGQVQAQTITTVAGNGGSSNNGDGTPATSAPLSYPNSVLVDGSGNLFICSGSVIRKVTASTGIIARIAGDSNGNGGFSGDGGQALFSTLNNPAGLAMDAAGNLYIADQYNQRIRKIAAGTNIITTVAGSSTTGGFGGDGGLATSAQLNRPYGVAVDAAGNLYIADLGNQRIRKVTASTGIITTVAGTGTSGFGGDNGAATSAQLAGPASVAVDAAGNIFVADQNNNRIRKVTVSTGIITTVAGSGATGGFGTGGFGGDGGAATSAQLNYPSGVAVDAAGNLFIGDQSNNRVRKVTASTGIITTVAGTGTSGFSGDNGLATSAQLASPAGVFITAGSFLYIADSGNNRIRSVSPTPPTVTTAAPANITRYLVTLGGNVTNTGDGPVTDRGVVYSSTNATPTTADTKQSIGTGTGSFSQSISGLTMGTLYYVRAYATNLGGTSYGAVQQFTPQDAAVYRALSLTGFNADVVAEASSFGSNSPQNVTTAGFDGSYVLYERGYNGTSGVQGLPAGGSFTSAVTTGLPYQLQAYTANNSLRLTAGSTGTLTLTKPAVVKTIYVLASSGGGASTITVTANFGAVTGGNTQVFAATAVPDWYGGPNAALAGFGRLQRTNNNSQAPDNSNAGNPRLYEISLSVLSNLQGAYYLKSVDIASASSSSGIVNVMGISVELTPTMLSAGANQFDNVIQLVTIPPGTSVQAQGWGGGGGGNNGVSSGGGGGAYATTILTGNNNYVVETGTGGGNNTDGTVSTAKTGAGTTVLLADAGKAGLTVGCCAQPGGAGGSAAASTPTTGAVSGAAGGGASGSTSGAGGTAGGLGGGTGGQAGFPGVTGSTGNAPGGGGGGGGGGNYAGGSGGNGRLVLTPIQAPTITSLNPASGPVGQSVTIMGTNFTNASTVSFNVTAATSLTYNSATSLTAVVPTGATTGSVTVTTIGGTSNGVTFTITVAPTVSTATPASITTTGATLGGNVTSDGGATVTDRGVVYSTSNATPTTADTKVSIGTGTGSFSQAVTGLTAGTLYYVRAYAINSVGTSYGTAQSFTTTAAPVPTLTSLSPTSGSAGTPLTLTGTGFTGATSVTFDIGFFGLTYSATPTVVNATTITVTVPANPYTAGATQVSVTTPGGTSNTQTFTYTTVGTPTVTTTTPASITGSSATLGGNVTSDGGATVTDRGVVYSTSNATPTVGGTASTQAANGTGTGSFSATVSGLTAGTLYYVAAYATNSQGTSYGAVQQFTTTAAATAPTVTTTAPASITTTGATLGGNVTADGGATVTESGVVYSTSNATPTTADTKVSISTGTGSFSQAVTGLTAGTLYYVRAYAINSVGTSYGTAQSFTTTAAPSALTVSTGTQASPTSIAAGSYTTISITGTGNAILGGAVSVSQGVTVQNGGSLNTNCQALNGAGSFTLSGGATLLVCDPAGLTASGATGAVQVTGTRSFSSDASYVYNGTAAQSTGAGLPSQVRNLTTTNANPVTMSQPVTVNQVLTVGAAGNLATGGNTLLLPSTATGTALAVNSGTGTVSGAATVQRFIDGSLNSGLGYRHYAAPVTNTTISDLTTPGFTPVLTQSYNSSATPGTTTPFPNVFGYDQSRLVSASNSNFSNFDKGFYVPQSTDAMTPGQGYAVNIAPGQLVDFVGTLGTGTVPVSLSRTTGTTAADAGWALVGNPYPAPLDYSQVAASDRTGLDAGMYVVQSTGPYTGGYRAFVNGVSTGTGTGNGLVASSQGFFVRVSSGQTTGSLTFRNAQRVTSYTTQQAFQRSTPDPRPQVRLALTGSGLADAWVAYAEAGASSAFDAQYDAAKLPNSTGLNLSSATATDDVAIDGQAAFTAATVLPLSVGVPTAGSYTLNAAALNNLPAGLDAYLRDALTGQVVKLAAGTSYGFTVANASALVRGRFSVVFRTSSALTAAAALTASEVGVYPNPAHGAFTLSVPGVAGAATVQAELLNALGQVVARQGAALPTGGAMLGFATDKMATGVYVLRVSAGTQTLVKRVVLD